MATSKTPDTPTLTDKLKDSLKPAGQNGEADTFSWDNLDAPAVMPSKVSTPNVKVNVLESVPGQIRQRAELSLAVNTAKVAAATGADAKRKRVDYDWRVQPVPSMKIAAQFIEHLSSYAKYRPDDKLIEFADVTSPSGQVTARTGEPSWYRLSSAKVPEACAESDDGAYLGVRYSVRPLEIRGGARRLPGTA